MNSLAGQTVSFIITIGTGGIIGLLFDGYRAFRSVLRLRQVGSAFLDLVFWIVITPIVFSSLLAANWGELRLYVAMGVGIGLGVYFLLFSPFVRWFLSRMTMGIGRSVGTGVQNIARILSFPFGRHRGSFLRRGGGNSGFGRTFHRRTPFRQREAWRRFSLRTFFHRID